MLWPKAHDIACSSRAASGSGSPSLREARALRADRYNHRIGNDDYTRPGNLFRLMTPEKKAVLMDNIAAAMAGVSEHIVRRQVAHFAKADPAYGKGVAERLGLDIALQAAE